jgi:hypothetical protein
LEGSLDAEASLSGDDNTNIDPDSHVNIEEEDDDIDDATGIDNPVAGEKEEEDVEYDQNSIPNDINHFTMIGKHKVLGFYRQLQNPIQRGTYKKGSFCVLCVKSLVGRNFNWYTWEKFTRVTTNNTTNALHHLKLKHGDMPVVQEEMKSKINTKKVPLALSTTSVASVASVCVPSSIAVKMTAGSIEFIKKDIDHWIVATGTTFLKSQAPSFRRIFSKQYPAYTSPSRETFNKMLDADNDRFVECVKGMLH